MFPLQAVKPVLTQEDILSKPKCLFLWLMTKLLTIVWMSEITSICKQGTLHPETREGAGRSWIISFPYPRSLQTTLCVSFLSVDSLMLKHSSPPAQAAAASAQHEACQWKPTRSQCVRHTHTHTRGRKVAHNCRINCTSVVKFIS